MFTFIALALASLLSTPDASQAAVEDLGFIVGAWRGEAQGMVIEEVWLPATQGNMACVFRMSDDTHVSLLELGSITDTEEGAVFYLRHFDSALVPWATEVDGPLEARVELIDEDSLRFNVTDPSRGVEAITYDVEGDTLTANVIFGAERDPFTLVFQREK